MVGVWKPANFGFVKVARHHQALICDANIDGALLASVASAHGGLYTRAESGLALEKFFAHAFGNIFEAGTITDPEFELPARERSGKPLPFAVCGEDAVTIVIGWDRADADLLLVIRTPGGTAVTGVSPTVQSDAGRTWAFLRIPLPFAGERDGTWTTTVVRPGGGEFPPPGVDLRYFVNVVATGGPILTPLEDRRRYYTGDPINPLVRLRHQDGSWPRDARRVSVTISRPTAALGSAIAKHGLANPVLVDGDMIPARQATIREIEQAKGGPLVTYVDDDYELSDESESTRGTFEAAGIWGREFPDLLAVDGTYLFHYRAVYGECFAQRETLRSAHIDVGIDPNHTKVSVTPTGPGSGGTNTGTLTFIPGDRFGNLVGPGAGGDLTVSPGPSTTVTGPVVDNGHGSYSVPVSWPASGGEGPSVVVGQPYRPVVVITPTSTPGTQAGDDCCDRPWRLIWLLVILLFLVLLVALLAILIR